MHSATASFKENAGYVEMLGTEFVAHGPCCEIASRENRLVEVEFDF